MPGPIQRSETVVTAVMTGGAAAEKVIATSPVLNIQPGLHGINVRFSLNAVIGTSGTALTVKVHAGSGTAGATLFNQKITVVATDFYQFAGEFQDDTAGLLSAQYTLTVTVTAEAAASTVNIASLIVEPQEGL